MADFQKNSEDFDEFFNLNLTETLSQNSRKSVRYVRKDIKAALQKKGLLKSNKVIRVKLHDISSKGALISSKVIFRLNSKQTILLIFKDRKQFSINAKIVRIIKSSETYYGMQFDSFNHDLGEHLLATQGDLTFT